MAIVLQVEGSTGTLPFEDYEVPGIKVRHIQPSNTQESMSGNVSVYFIGLGRYEWDLTFAITVSGASGTLEKLEIIRGWREPFTLRPYYYDEGGLTEYTAVWPGEPVFEQQYVFGRRQRDVSRPDADRRHRLAAAREIQWHD